jgi:hypothetical protein
MNNVTVKPHVDATDVRDKIEAAFRRSAEIDARRINITAKGRQGDLERQRALVDRERRSRARSVGCARRSGG